MSENSDFKRLPAYEAHYSLHPASPTRKPDSLSLDFEGIGKWQETLVSGDEEYPLDIGECDDGIEDPESPAQHGASPSSCIFSNSPQQHIDGPLTPITTPSRRGFSPQYLYLPRRRPNEIPSTPTHDEEGEGFHRDNLGRSCLVWLSFSTRLTYLKSRTRVSHQIRPITKAHSSSPTVTMPVRTPPTEALRKDAPATSTSRATAPSRTNRGTVQMMKINQPDSLFNNLSPKTVRLSLLTRILNGIGTMRGPP